MPTKKQSDKAVPEQDTATETDQDESAQQSPEDSEEIIRRHVGYSLVAGALPLPLVDIAAVTVIQVDMLHKLADAHGVGFDQARGRSVTASLLGATGGHLLGRVGASLVKGIPGIGSLLGIGSQIVLAGASTYAVGKVFDDHFSRGGTLANFNAASWRAPFERFVASGQTVAERMRAQQNSDDVIETLKKLKELKDAGTISEKEYEETKAALLQKLQS